MFRSEFTCVFSGKVRMKSETNVVISKLKTVIMWIGVCLYFGSLLFKAIMGSENKVGKITHKFYWKAQREDDYSRSKK